MMSRSDRGSVSVPNVSPRGWRNWLQFSLRSLLLVITLAAVFCWWFLLPQTREEQFEDTPLRLRRQIRLVKIDREILSPPKGSMKLIEPQFVVVNDGYWQLRDASGHLLVTGYYQRGWQHGQWTTFHSNGRVAATGWMDDGLKIGLWRTWDEEGRMIGEVVYSSGEVQR